MIKITILTLFPDFIDSIRSYGVLGKAIEKGIIELEILNIRDFSKDKHNKVDDEIYGGGAGMLMTVQPVFDAINFSKNDNSKVIFLSPQGEVLTQNKCKELSKDEHLIFLCGHYEGIDQRVLDKLNVEEISVGDYILTGGEIPAMIIIDSVSRNIEGVISKDSLKEESFSEEIGMLEYPQYTRPEIFEQMKVPDVLLSRKS